jgi:hypothetical protein
MKVNKNNLNEVYKIMKSFNYYPKASEIKENKIKMPKHILKYTQERLLGENKIVAGFKTKYVSYMLEKVLDTFYLTRILADGDETKVLLTSEDLRLIKDFNDVKVPEVKALVKKIDDHEKRFGL